MARMPCVFDYIERGWPAFPVSHSKIPLTEHGRSDATLDPAIVQGWRDRWSHCLFAVATGAESGIAALDVDISDQVHGPDSLEALGVHLHPESPTAHTPRGGFHVLFKHPGHFVKTVAGKLGAGLDIRGDGGSIILPPGPGRYWDPVYGLDTPLATMPDWMVIPEPKPASEYTAGPIIAFDGLSAYAEAALDNALDRIVSAPAGEQEVTLNREAHSIGRLVGGNVIPADLGLRSLLRAASRMPSHDSRRPWRHIDLEKKVRFAFTDGHAKPRGIPR